MSERAPRTPPSILEPQGRHPGALVKGRALERVALFAILVVLFALVGRGTFFTSDEGGIFNTTLVLVRQHTLALPGAYENVHQGRDNRYYSCREILPSLSSIPFCVTGMVVELGTPGVRPPVAPRAGQREVCNWPIFLTVTLLGPMLAAATLLLIYTFVLAEGGRRSDALWLALATGWATPLVVYAKTIFPQVFEATLLMLAFAQARQWRHTGSPQSALYLGIANGLGMLTRATFAPLSLWFLGYLLMAGPASRRARLQAVLLFLMPLVLGAAGTGYVNWLRWESPLDFGYHHPYETFSTPLWEGLYGLLASPGRGVWFHAPVLILPLLFGRVLWQRGRHEVLLAMGLTFTYLAIYSRWYDWPGGLCWGPRFLLPLFAPWLALLGRAFSGPTARWARGLLLPTALVGTAIQVVGVVMDPHWMNRLHTDVFSLDRAPLVQLGQMLFEQGPDDLWLWSRAARSSPGFTSVVITLLMIAVGAAAILWYRATTRAERLTVLGMLISVGLLTSGVLG